VLLVYGPGHAPTIFAWGPPIAEALHIPRLGLVGAGWATIIARTLALLPTFFITFRRHNLFRKDSRERPNKRIIQKVWQIGWPTSSQLVVRIIAILAVVAFAQRGYTTAANQDTATALGVVLRWETMALFVGLGWGSASQTFMGQNLGAGNFARAKASGWYMCAYNAIMMAFFALACLMWGEEMIAFFSPGTGVVQTGVEYFNWVAPSYVGLGVGIVLGSAIQGAGATRLTYLIDQAVIALFQIPACWLVVRVLQTPATGLWLVVAMTYWMFAVVYVVFYRRGRFLHTALG
jgi:Na+-driven multidrug efflux pump